MSKFYVKKLTVTVLQKVQVRCLKHREEIHCNSLRKVCYTRNQGMENTGEVRETLKRKKVREFSNEVDVIMASLQEHEVQCMYCSCQIRLLVRDSPSLLPHPLWEECISPTHEHVTYNDGGVERIVCKFQVWASRGIVCFSSSSLGSSLPLHEHIPHLVSWFLVPEDKPATKLI